MAVGDVVVKVTLWGVVDSAGPVTVSTPLATAAEMPSAVNVELPLMSAAREASVLSWGAVMLVTEPAFSATPKVPARVSEPGSGPRVAAEPALVVAAVGAEKLTTAEPAVALPPLELTQAESASAMVWISA